MIEEVSRRQLDNNYSPKWRWLVVDLYQGRVISGTACFISCEISLFVTAANQEGILLETYASLASLARRNWR